jgi:hypothetical protein
MTRGINTIAENPDWGYGLSQEEITRQEEMGRKRYEEARPLNNLLAEIYTDPNHDGHNLAVIKKKLNLDENASEELDNWWRDCHGGILLEEANPDFYDYLVEQEKYEKEIAMEEREAEKELTKDRPTKALDQTGEWVQKQGWRGGKTPRPHDKSRRSKKQMETPSGKLRYMGRPDKEEEDYNRGLEEKRRHREERQTVTPEIQDALYGDERDKALVLELREAVAESSAIGHAYWETLQQVKAELANDEETYIDDKGQKHTIRSWSPEAKADLARELAIERLRDMSLNQILSYEDWDYPEDWEDTGEQPTKYTGGGKPQPNERYDSRTMAPGKRARLIS